MGSQGNNPLVIYHPDSEDARVGAILLYKRWPTAELKRALPPWTVDPQRQNWLLGVKRPPYYNRRPYETWIEAVGGQCIALQVWERLRVCTCNTHLNTCKREDDCAYSSPAPFWLAAFNDLVWKSQDHPWRDAVLEALGVDYDPECHTPEEVGRHILDIREMGNHCQCAKFQRERDDALAKHKEALSIAENYIIHLHKAETKKSALRAGLQYWLDRYDLGGAVDVDELRNLLGVGT